jgi:hypothetical protein
MPAPFDREYPATLTSLADARVELRAWLRTEVADECAADDLLSAAGEFFLHVVVRTGGDRGRARVVAERGPDGVRLAVTAVEVGARAPLRSVALPQDPLSAGSLGRRLVDGCCDEVEVERGAAIGVRGRRSLQPAGGAPDAR